VSGAEEHEVRAHRTQLSAGEEPGRPSRRPLTRPGTSDMLFSSKDDEE
jgi:hypothetical protein